MAFYKDLINGLKIWAHRGNLYTRICDYFYFKLISPIRAVQIKFKKRPLSLYQKHFL